jgi:tetratricopeptide (TPR) repeat protein
MVFDVYRRLPHHLQILLVLTSLIPTFMIAIRWKSHFGDSSRLGTALTTGIFHLTHAVLLGVCIWAAFDTGFSLRDAPEKVPFLDYNRDQLLPLYFMAAVCVGYLSGYFLLIFRPVTQRLQRPDNSLTKVLNQLSVCIICALLVLTPIGLLYKNLPQIKITNSRMWQQYASALTGNLPPHAVLLSDRSDILLLVQGSLTGRGKASDYVFLNTDWLRFPAYHRWQKVKHPDIWPPLTKEMYQDNFRFRDLALIDLLARLSNKSPLYYLHPSFGAFFESFYMVPHGLVYELKEYPNSAEISQPPLPEEVFVENEGFWKTHEPEYDSLLPFINPPGPGATPTFRQQWMQRMRIPFEKNKTAVDIGSINSLALNTLGVQEQRLGRLDAAGRHFAEAQQFSPDNVVAAANLDFNRKLRGGERIVADSLQSFEDHFGKFSGWEPLLNVNGLFDTATGCLAEGIVFAQGRLGRQAAQQFERTLSLVPDNQLAQLWLARGYAFSPTPEKAFPLIQNLKARPDSWNDSSITPADVLRVEFEADYKDKKAEGIHSKIKDLSDTNLLDAAAQTCVNFGDYTNALVAVENKLRINPDDVPALVTAGFVDIRMSNYDRAVLPLTRAVALQPTNGVARMNRAVAYFGSGLLDEAQNDCETLVKAFPQATQIYFMLAEIASRKKDNAAALHYYELCLSNSPPNSDQAKILTERINKLKPASP